jgi:hypothetical protein
MGVLTPHLHLDGIVINIFSLIALEKNSGVVLNLLRLYVRWHPRETFHVIIQHNALGT